MTKLKRVSSGMRIPPLSFASLTLRVLMPSPVSTDTSKLPTQRVELTHCPFSMRCCVYGSSTPKVTVGVMAVFISREKSSVTVIVSAPMGEGGVVVAFQRKPGASGSGAVRKGWKVASPGLKSCQ